MSVKKLLVCDGCKKEVIPDPSLVGQFKEWVEARIYEFSNGERSGEALVYGDFCSLECARKAVQRAEDLL